MPIPVQSFATTPLGNSQQQLRNRIAMQMMMGRPGMTAPRPVVMPPQLRGYVDPNQQPMQQQRALQQQQVLGGIFDPRVG